MASMGISLYIIQVLARWASSMIVHYIKEAPLQALTAAYRARAGVKEDDVAQVKVSGQDGDVVSPGINKSLVDIQNRMQTFIDKLDSQQAVIDKLAEQQVSTDVSFVHNPLSHVKGGSYHFTKSSITTPPDTWITSGCGWSFGRKRHVRLSSIPESVRFVQICERCLPEVRGEHRKQQCINPNASSDSE